MSTLSRRRICSRIVRLSVLAGAFMLALTAGPSAQPAQQNMFARGVNLSGAEFGKIPGRPNFDYLYPTSREIESYAQRGVTIIRLPFKWERLQPALNAPFDAGEEERLAATVDAVTSMHIICLIDPHNYGWYVKDGVKHMIGSPEVPATAFVDFWKRLAARFKDNPRVWFGLMNEPHGMTADRWRDSAQAAMTAIRQTGARNKVLVPGTGFSTANTWISSGNAAAMANFRDAGKNFAFEVHQYLDRKNSGTTGACVEGAGSTRLAVFEQWLRGQPGTPKAFLGEFAGGDSTIAGQGDCQSELTALLQEVESRKALWLGWAVWGGGILWARNYHFRLGSAGAAAETNLMRFYQQYWKRR